MVGIDLAGYLMINEVREIVNYYMNFVLEYFGYLLSWNCALKSLILT